MKRRPKKRRKIVASVFLLGLVLYVVSLLWLLPPFLKTPINKQLKNNDLQINYQKLWINPLTLNIHLKNTELNNLSGHEILAAKKIDIDWQLWPLINRNIQIDSLTLKQAELQLIFGPDNQLISPSFKSNTSESPWQFNPGQLNVINSTVTLQKQQQKLHFKDININLNLADLINPQQPASNQTARIHLETGPDSDFSIEQSSDNTFHWQLNNWSLEQIEPWIRPYKSDIELIGKVTASGQLQWPANTMPLIQVTEAELNIQQLNWPPFKVQQGDISTRDIQFDLASKKVNMAYIKSPGGELAIESDLINLTDLKNQQPTSDNQWQLNLESLEVTNWQLMLQDNRPAIKADIEHISVQSESQQQNLSVKVKLTAPFDQAININAHGQVSPLQLQGNLKAEALALEALNPWLQALSPWQFQQTLLSVNSELCVRNNSLYANGDWSLPQLTVKSNSQGVVARDTKIQSIGLNIDEKLLTLNDVRSQTVDFYQYDNDTASAENTKNAPQSTEQLWRVAIDQDNQDLCDIKLL